MPQPIAAMFRLLALLTLLTACAEFPQLDARISDDLARAEYPAIAPLGPILARADTLAPAGPSAPQALAPVQDRIAALNARAARLRGPVIPPQVRARMLRGVPR